MHRHHVLKSVVTATMLLQPLSRIMIKSYASCSRNRGYIIVDGQAIARRRNKHKYTKYNSRPLCFNIIFCLH